MKYIRGNTMKTVICRKETTTPELPTIQSDGNDVLGNLQRRVKIEWVIPRTRYLSSGTALGGLICRDEYYPTHIAPVGRAQNGLGSATPRNT